MINSITYVLKKEDCHESYQPITIKIIGEIPMDEVKKVHQIRMFDRYHDWFRSEENDIEIIDTGRDTIGDYKFIEYDLKDGKVLTVVFSKLVNHDHMDEFIGRIIHKRRLGSSLGSCRAKRAGFICGERKFGKSESLRIDYEGNKF
ncbi:hypothetical protein P19_0143 [Aeromonas phage P19]|uniref:Uncharacterized protein n=1 Tax=Aeromonas phage vB_AdhaM_G2 TaxID=3238786 RepID=A0AB39TZ83_9CAUD|nr:hypothetical protein P19_0143 [Aeromonas phage P19]